ncbi:hypothetical protein Tco_0028608 [Tanacetum coccineum]
MVISSPCLIDNKELTSPEQTAPGKDFSNPLIVDSLLKTIWSSMHHVFTMKHWLVQSKRLLHNMVAFLEKSTGSEGFHQVIDFLNQSHICYAILEKSSFGGLLKLLMMIMEKSSLMLPLMVTQ